MAYARIIHYATSILCCNKGSMDYLQLHRKVFQRFDISEDDFWYIVRKCSRFSVVRSSSDKSSEDWLSSECTIIAKTSLRLCKNYTKQECSHCQELHLCKYFVYGNCRYGKGRKECKYSHDLRSDHNYPILRECTLHELNEEDLFLLLLQNDPSLLPEVCAHYNKGTGLYGACTFKTNCTKLHICQHFVQDNCMFGHKCKRSHMIDEHGRRMLEERGLSGDIIHELPFIYRNVYKLNARTTYNSRGIADCVAGPSVQEEEKSEICLHYIRRNCMFQEQCIRVHFHLPYKWEVFDGTSWKELRHMEEIERAYCDPRNTHSNGSRPIDFLSMSRESSSVRRLSTASSVTKPPHYILTTEWVWYYKGDHENWIEYGKPDDKQRVASITSKELELAFLADSSAELTVLKGHRKYILSFRDMYQRNPKHNTKRRVRRRPRFVSVQDVENKIARKSETSAAQGSSHNSTPDTWDQTALPETGYALIQLSDSDEYKKVQDLFLQTMRSATICNIKRIQNLSLWEVYQWQKQQMKKRNGKDVKEKLLFHGTQKSNVEAICNQNFDWRICGIHGTAYGKGTYFATDASYSHTYSASESDRRLMFVARVLVGEITGGKASYLRPPSKDDGKTFYDSCVNNVSHPTVFVVFEKHQIYPEYIIEYRMIIGDTSEGNKNEQWPSFCMKTKRQPNIHEGEHED
ncbi:protein mono-ADP-ribosyltransferase PARP12b isoform X2 [Amia ocellicauda]|uniref:protein mono-ADP-ribosyltransferase PARP12b isoform X2 n=1 Tax=Amia ocellicauda TaxID=2972642 RepID=UPI003463A639